MEGRRAGHTVRRAARSHPGLWLAIVVALCALMPATCGCVRLRRSAAKPAALHITSGGIDRTYILHVPPKGPGPQGYPLVLSYHGHGGDGAGQERLTRMDATADANGFVVAYPDGIDRAWNDGRSADSNPGVDDVAFTRDLIKQIEKDHRIDPRRVYATGMSNGGMMCYRLALEMPHDIAAIAPVAALMSTEMAAGPAPSSPMSVMIIAGTDDPLMPFGGGPVGFGLKGRGDVLSAPDTARYWAKADGCNLEPATASLPDKDPADGTRLGLARFGGGTAGTEVQLCIVQGGGHTWPGGQQYASERLVGPTSMDAAANEMIWNFFKAHLTFWGQV
jgi:polyhydroxybutyrate depolymerase